MSNASAGRGPCGSGPSTAGSAKFGPGQAVRTCSMGQVLQVYYRFFP
jgi:hypothetical protein